MTLVVGLSAEALRRVGTWSEQGYEYGSNGQEPIARKRFLWACAVRSVHGDQPLELAYFADAVVDPRRMNDLAYLAEREGGALALLSSMVREALGGVAYLGIPDPGVEIGRDVTALVEGWITQGGYPDNWREGIETAVRGATFRITAWRQSMATLRAVPDPQGRGWGMAVQVHPPEVPEDAS